MRNKYKYIIYNILIILLCCSCEKIPSYRSGEVSFGAKSIGSGHPLTKTAYAGSDNVSGGIEPIWWLSSDQVRILSAQAATASSAHYADYAVTPDSTDPTVGTIAATGEALLWGEASTHYFYAVYPPLPMTSTNDGTAASVTASIPAAQAVTQSGTEYLADMDYAYMYSSLAVSVNEEVDLTFYPMFTAFTFSIYTDPDDAITSNLVALTLSSTQTSAYLTGDFTASLTTSGLTALTTSEVTSGGNTITVDLGEGVSLATTQSGEYKITVFALPMDQTALRVTLGFANGETRSLDLRKNGVNLTFSACNKICINHLMVPNDDTSDINYVVQEWTPTSTDGKFAWSVTGVSFLEGDYVEVCVDVENCAEGVWEEIITFSRGNLNNWNQGVHIYYDANADSNGNNHGLTGKAYTVDYGSTASRASGSNLTFSENLLYIQINQNGIFVKTDTDTDYTEVAELSNADINPTTSDPKPWFKIGSTEGSGRSSATYKYIKAVSTVGSTITYSEIEN